MGIKTERVCPVCGALYTADITRLKHGRETTCSRQCSYILRANTLEQPNTKVSVTCSVCGKEFTRHICKMKSKHQAFFCSTECQYKARTLGITPRIVDKPYVITPEAYIGWNIGAQKTRAIRIKKDNYKHKESTKKLLSEATIKQLSDGRMSHVSKLEDRVALQLSNLGANYERQKGFRNSKGQYICVLDFWFPDFGIALEVNGTYWHADSRFFSSDMLNSTQLRGLEKFSNKARLLEELSIPLFIIWEYDFNQSPVGSVRDVYKAIRRYSKT